MTLITAKPMAGVDSKDAKAAPTVLGQQVRRAATELPPPAATPPREPAHVTPAWNDIEAAADRHARARSSRCCSPCVFFATQSDRFLTGENFSLVLQQVMVVGVIAIGQTLDHPHRRHRPVLRHGDGAGRHRDDQAGGRPAACPRRWPSCAASASTTAFGLVNGLLVTRIKLPPFIVTLGTLNIAFAITQLYSNAQTVTDLPPAMTWLRQHLHDRRHVGRLRRGAHAAAVSRRVVRGCAKPPPGRHVYAVGNNPEATRLTGIATERVLLGVYVLAGVFYGIAALLSVARTGVGDPNAGQTENLDAITAVVLGGTEPVRRPRRRSSAR